MGRRIAGRFQATDDINLDGHHIVGMTFLEDLPRGGAEVGQVMVWKGDSWGPTTLTGDGGSYVVTWGDVLEKPETFDTTWGQVSGKPATFTPSTHTHTVADVTDFPATWAWTDLTGVPDLVNDLSAGTGISLSTSTGSVTITCDLTWSELADKPTSFNPSTHTHTVADITNFPDTWAWTDLTGVPDLVNTISTSGALSASTSTGNVTLTNTMTWGTLPDKPTFVNSVSAGTNINISTSTGTVVVNVITNPEFDGTITANSNLVGYANLYADYDSVDGRLEMNIARRGYVIDLVNETGGWARGLVFYDGTTLLGGYQGYGATGDSISRLSIAADFDEPYGLHVQPSNGHVNVGTFTGDALLTVYGRTAVEPLLTEFIVNNQDGKVRIGQIGGDFGFYWKYMGTGSGANNTLQFWTENQTGADIEVWECDQNGDLTFNNPVTFNGTANLSGFTIVSDGASDFPLRLQSSDPSVGMQFVDSVTTGEMYFNGTLDRFYLRDGANNFIARVDNGLAAFSGDIYANYNGPEGDGTIYFYNDGVATSRRLRWDDSADNFNFNDDVKSSGSFWAESNLISNGNAFLNYVGPDGDSYLYFYEASSPTGAWLRFTDSGNEFRMNHRLRVDSDTENIALALESSDSQCIIQLVDPDGYANVTQDGNEIFLQPGGASALGAFSSQNVRVYGSFLCDGNVYVNYAGPDGDGYLYFYEGGNTGKSLSWQNTLALFLFDDDVRAQGNLYADSNVYVNANGGDGDSSVYFYEGVNTGASLTWDHSETRFQLSHNMYVDGDVLETCVDVLTNDTSTSSTTPSASGLSASVDAPAYYVWRAVLLTEGTSSLSPNLEVAPTKPSGSVVYFADNVGGGSGTIPVTTKTTITVSGTSITLNTLDGVFYTGVTTGSFGLNYNLAGIGGAVKLLRGSVLELRRVG